MVPGPWHEEDFMLSYKARVCPQGAYDLPRQVQVETNISAAETAGDRRSASAQPVGCSWESIFPIAVPHC